MTGAKKFDFGWLLLPIAALSVICSTYGGWAPSPSKEDQAKTEADRQRIAVATDSDAVHLWRAVKGYRDGHGGATPLSVEEPFWTKGKGYNPRLAAEIDFDALQEKSPFDYYVLPDGSVEGFANSEFTSLDLMNVAVVVAPDGKVTETLKGHP